MLTEIFFLPLLSKLGFMRVNIFDLKKLPHSQSVQSFNLLRMNDFDRSDEYRKNCSKKKWGREILRDKISGWVFLQYRLVSRVKYCTQYLVVKLARVLQRRRRQQFSSDGSKYCEERILNLRGVCSGLAPCWSQLKVFPSIEEQPRLTVWLLPNTSFFSVTSLFTGPRNVYLPQLCTLFT